jgi:hypothetical protein
MDISNKQNLLFGIIFFATSVIAFIRGETIALISSIGMTLIFLLIYITFKIIQRKLDV